ncbi:Arc family DNA-binding protein [Limosilactobacillus reuteri]|uniref:Arc family DNA-binding protein n=1 Tax=Limosilactobacillus reuteri TaxID=1598 RepID=UPI001CDCA6A0|nr:Arc family DNA-binding protein [Limosilactobacillus reuteri]MCH5385713.1 Arc family DNA-binding protein [Limosilactobacillus reuteri]
MYTLPSRKPFFSLRIPVELMDKLKYIADYNGRSANKEIEQLVIKHVRDFEKENGQININKD